MHPFWRVQIKEEVLIIKLRFQPQTKQFRLKCWKQMTVKHTMRRLSRLQVKEAPSFLIRRFNSHTIESIVRNCFTQLVIRLKRAATISNMEFLRWSRPSLWAGNGSTQLTRKAISFVKSVTMTSEWVWYSHQSKLLRPTSTRVASNTQITKTTGRTPKPNTSKTKRPASLKALDAIFQRV